MKLCQKDDNVIFAFGPPCMCELELEWWWTVKLLSFKRPLLALRMRHGTMRAIYNSGTVWSPIQNAAWIIMIVLKTPRSWLNRGSVSTVQAKSLFTPRVTAAQCELGLSGYLFCHIVSKTGLAAGLTQWYFRLSNCLASTSADIKI